MAFGAALGLLVGLGATRAAALYVLLGVPFGALVERYILRYPHGYRG